jgi:hypothetical protein
MGCLADWRTSENRPTPTATLVLSDNVRDSEGHLGLVQSGRRPISVLLPRTQAQQLLGLRPSLSVGLAYASFNGGYPTNWYLGPYYLQAVRF